MNEQIIGFDHPLVAVPSFPTRRGPSWIEVAFAGASTVFAFVGSALLFYPGTATHDALAVYDQAQAWDFGDWQPPLAGVLWRALEPVFGFGPQAIMLPTLACYWGALFVVFLALRRTGSPWAWLALGVGVLPPTFALIGIVWRDVIFSVMWLAAFALALLTGGRQGWPRWIGLTLGLALFLVGFWLRPNAIFCAVPLLAHLIWPDRWLWRRVLLLAVPALVGLQLSAMAINSGWLKARENHALHSIFVFDLTGITHFSGTNVFPVDEWSPEQVQKIVRDCYNPAYWDSIWWPRCSFAMESLNREDRPEGKLFGSPTLVKAWLAAIVQHPVAYAEHRLLHFWALMAWHNLVVFDPAEGRQWRFFPIRSQAYWVFDSTMTWLHDWTPLFRGAPWLLLSGAIGMAARRLSPGRAQAAVMALAGSGVVYALTYLVVGVAAEYRYIYWTALSALVGTAVLVCKWDVDHARPPSPAGILSGG